MKLELLPQDFTVCKVKSPSDIDLSVEYCFVGKTDSELSLVCPTASAPADCAAREDGWRAFRVVGTMEFSLVGILAGLSRCLADAKVGIFAVSTYDTDYVLFKSENLAPALTALRSAGYEIG